VKSGIVFVVVLLTLFPDPRLLLRHLQHVQRADALPDSNDPAIVALSRRFDEHVAELESEEDLLPALEAFVHGEVPYGWDWEVWGCVDYLPSVAEVVERGREDCDGRAVLAAALLRARGIDARLVGDFRHMWVRTPMGDTMNPLGSPVFDVQDEQVVVAWGRLLDIGPVGFGISVFPVARESIILLTVWLMVLPARVRWPSALAGLFVMVAGLVVVRIAGQDPLEPSRWGIGLGLVIVLAGLWFAGRLGGQRRSRGTDRSVFFNGDKD
jgi:hypothetical protein